MRPCFACRNVWSKETPCRPGHVDICCTEPAQFLRLDSATLEGMYDVLLRGQERVASGDMNKGEFEDLQKAMGFTSFSRVVTWRKKKAIGLTSFS